MSSFEYLSARASIRQIEHGVIEVNYCGVMTRACIKWLAPKVLAATIGAPAMVVRFDTAVLAMSSIPDFPFHRTTKNLPVAAIVVQEGDIEMMTEYSHRMALAGVMRAVFSASQVNLAYQWAEAHALAALSVSPQSQNCKRLSVGSAP